MTINEALEVLRKKYGCFTKGVCIGDECRDCEYSTEYDAFIDALKTVLDAFGNRSELPNSSGDLISRQAAIDVIEDVETKRLKGEIGMIYAPAIKGLRALLPAQADSTDNAEFWRKRAKDYENMVINLTAKISKDARLESMEMNAEGLVFKMKEPSVQAEQEWIPCSERLPKYWKRVLVCFKAGRKCPHDQIQVGCFGTHEVEDEWFEKIGNVTVLHTDKYYYPLDNVTAWMPLPEPYRGDTE